MLGGMFLKPKCNVAHMDAGRLAHASNLDVHARAGQLALSRALLQRRAVRVRRRQLALGRLPADDLPPTRMHSAITHFVYIKERYLLVEHLQATHKQMSRMASRELCAAHETVCWVSNFMHNLPSQLNAPARALFPFSQHLRRHASMCLIRIWTYEPCMALHFNPEGYAGFSARLGRPAPLSLLGHVAQVPPGHALRVGGQRRDGRLGQVARVLAQDLPPALLARQAKRDARVEARQQRRVQVLRTPETSDACYALF